MLKILFAFMRPRESSSVLPHRYQPGAYNKRYVSWRSAVID